MIALAGAEVSFARAAGLLAGQGGHLGLAGPDMHPELPGQVA
jgi:hypothetical protein